MEEELEKDWRARQAEIYEDVGKWRSLQIEIEHNILCRERENEGRMEEDYEDGGNVSP